ncbi:MAG: adenylate/guanylate cyclase with Chase sensor, partial [Lacunisphaera sp.]|nr:adenylate/guanylate cyclase with Chase sensor [Lacunisphaera sp.]
MPLLWAFLAQSGYLLFLDNWLLDLRFRLRGEIETNVKVVYVDIDSQSLSELGNFPWPRSHFSLVSDKLVNVGAVTAVGIDVVFSEQGVSESYDRVKWVEANRDLARFLQKNPPVVVAASYSADQYRDAVTGKLVTPDLPLLRNGLPPIDKINPPELPEFNIGRTMMWNPPRVGLIDTLDGGTRWIPLFTPTSIKRYDHMALNLALLYWGVGPEALKIAADRIDVMAPNGSLITTIPLVDGQLLEVNWFSQWLSDKNPRIGFSTVYNYARMLADPNEAAQKNARDFFRQFQGAVVLIGPVDKLLQDLAPTSLDEVPVPRVGIHGNVLKTLVSGEFLQRLPPWSLHVLTVGLTVVVTLLAATGGPRSIFSKILALLILAAFTVVSFHLFTKNRLIIPMAAPLGAAFSTAFIGIIWQLVLEEKQKGRIKSMFGTYLAPELVNRMVESEADPQLGGHEEVITAYFSDIQEFSTFSEVMTPKKLVELMNEYLTACTDIVQEEKGTLDKYIGDAVVTIFGAPLAVPDHAYRACVATVRVQRKIDELREKWTHGVDSEGQPWPEKVHKFRARLGLNTGPVIIGNMGSRSRFSYTMMGDNVNLAARMESGAKAWGAFTMVTEATKLECEKHGGDQVVFRQLGKIVVKGRSLPVTTYEVTGLKETVTPQTRECLRIFEEGLQRYYARDWDGALALFGQSSAIEPLVVGVAPGVKGNPSTVYIAICQDYRKNPPPADWDGVYV